MTATLDFPFGALEVLLVHDNLEAQPEMSKSHPDYRREIDECRRPNPF